MTSTVQDRLVVLLEKLKQTDDSLAVCIVLLQQYLRGERDKILVVAILGAVSAGAPENRDKRGLISSLGYGWDHSLALHSPSWSHPVATSIVAAPTIVKTISHAPIIKTIVAPQPIIKTVVPAPHIYSYAPAPVISYGHSLSSLPISYGHSLSSLPLSYKWAGHYPLSAYSW